MSSLILPILGRALEETARDLFMDSQGNLDWNRVNTFAERNGTWFLYIPLIVVAGGVVGSLITWNSVAIADGNFGRIMNLQTPNFTIPFDLYFGPGSVTAEPSAEDALSPPEESTVSPTPDLPDSVIPEEESE